MCSSLSAQRYRNASKVATCAVGYSPMYTARRTLSGTSSRPSAARRNLNTPRRLVRSTVKSRSTSYTSPTSARLSHIARRKPSPSAVLITLLLIVTPSVCQPPRTTREA
ncbi:MAG: hypothetical protein [Circular genetic element sp.]|nr:MAG: hypothetical protein [Circular genetic element sp.]